MIERFNFYDVFGYFIPGAVLIAVLWLPNALAADSFRSPDLSAALAMIIAAYVAGHILQIVASKAIPSSKRVGEKDRAPSDLMLDEKNTTFAWLFRAQILEAIQERLKIDARMESYRKDAFLLCRDTVIASKTASYVEQFEGMYVMMRGITAAAAVGFAYDLGWLFGPAFEPRIALVAFAFCMVGSFVAWQHIKVLEMRTALPLFALGAVVCAGALIANGAVADPLPLSVAAGISALVTVLAFGSYHAFAWTWARTVYEHFYLIVRTPPEAKP